MKSIKIMFLLFAILSVLSACNIETSNDNGVLTVTNHSDSITIETFEKLNLGTLLTFNYKWKQADKTYIHIWAEGYQKGKKIEPNLADLMFGQHPSEEVVEEDLSFGFIQTSDGPYILLTTSYVKNTPQKLNIEFLDQKASAWDYAIQGREISAS